MNSLKHYLLTAVFIFIATVTFSQARVQVIHNSADAAAEVVDVWQDQTLLLDNFAFRTASPFVDVPSGVPVTISVKESDSQDPSNPIWSQTYTLTEGEAYILVAEGIVSPSGYDPPTPFDVAVYTGAHESASMSDLTDMMIHHGSTDAPLIDIYEIGVGLGQIVDNLGYAEFDPYEEVPTKDYLFKVTDASGNIEIASYSASFQEFGLKGKAVTIVASGFFIPGNNSDGPEFGLWAAPASGGPLIELPVFDPHARVQVIHNSADAEAATVDVWLDEMLLIDNFAFRTSSPFMDVPAAKEITISITGPDSQNPDNPIWSGNFTLSIDQKYIMVAEGIVSPTGYDPPTPFDVAIYQPAREMASMTSRTDVLMHHGSTDAPVIDIYEAQPGTGLWVDNLAYAGFSGYLELQPEDYIIEVRNESGTEKIAAYELPLETLGLDSYAITVLASGFLDPGNNNNGPDFGLWFTSALGGNLIKLAEYSPTARVQIIHNSADEAAEIVDIWLDDELLLDNFAFQTASPFTSVKAAEEITISVKGPDSQNPDNPLWTGNFTLNTDGTYILVADGIISTSGYEPLIPFDIKVYPAAREEANQQSQTDLLIHHGSTDAPSIDIIEVGIGLGQVVDNLAYGQFAGYFGFATVNYIFQVRDETGLTKIAAYEVPLATLGLQGDAVTIIASGFLDPGNNNEGPEFGLFIVKASGGAFLKLPVYAPMARLQVIHNSADTALDVVDIWLNQELLLDDFAYHTASPFIDAPADEQLTISIKRPDSEDPYNPLYFHNYELTEGETYIMVANGIISNNAYNPPELFDIAVYPTAREEANIDGRTDILVHHGSTDAPAVDVYEIGLGAGLLIDNLGYAEYSSYLELPTIDYILEVRNESTSEVIGKFRAPLETFGLQNVAITVVASGFIAPENNSNGPEFGLWAAVPAGGAMIELQPYVPSARVQFIHNSADMLLSVVDIWVDDDLVLDDFAFRTATSYLYIPSDIAIDVTIAQSGSESPENPLWSKSYTLTTDERYILVTNGILSPSGYSPQEPFDMLLYEGAEEEASDPEQTDVLIFHGATDVPEIDINFDDLSTGLTLDPPLEDLAFGEFDGYLQLPADNFMLTLTGAEPFVSRAFEAPLTQMNVDGETLTILASGFFDPSVNSSGPAFGLLAVRVDGTASLLTDVTGIQSPEEIVSLNAYPNPAGQVINVAFEIKSRSSITIEVVDLSGRVIISGSTGVRDAGVYIEPVSLEYLPAGLYLLNLRTDDGFVSRKLIRE